MKEKGMVLRGQRVGIRILHQRQRSKGSLQFILSVVARKNLEELGKR